MDPRDPSTWPGGHWYRNRLDSGVFHHEAPDWVRSGKALCGSPIRNPALTVSNPTPAQKLCRTCLARKAKTMTTKTPRDYVCQFFSALTDMLRAIHAGDFRRADEAHCVMLGSLIRGGFGPDESE